jgi:hypothetical protein
MTGKRMLFRLSLYIAYWLFCGLQPHFEPVPGMPVVPSPIKTGNKKILI